MWIITQEWQTIFSLCRAPTPLLHNISDIKIRIALENAKRNHDQHCFHRLLPAIVKIVWFLKLWERSFLWIKNSNHKDSTLTWPPCSTFLWGLVSWAALAFSISVSPWSPGWDGLWSVSGKPSMFLSLKWVFSRTTRNLTAYNS